MKKRAIVVSVILLSITIGVIGTVFVMISLQNQPDSKDVVGNTSDESVIVLSSASQSEFVGGVMEEYSEDYMAARARLLELSPEEWSEADIVSAYFVIEYADKASDFFTVITFLDRLDVAAAAGADIDNSTIGANEVYRGGMRLKNQALYDRMNNYDEEPGNESGK